MSKIEEFERHPLKYLGDNLGIAIGLVLVWRGLWYIMDAADIYLFGGTHWVSALGGIILGVLVLYLPHHNLKALERL